MTSCAALRPNPQKCPSSHCLCVSQPHFLQLSAGVFPPVSHQKSCSSLFLPHCNANRLAGRAGGCASQGRAASTAPGQAQQSRLDLVCQHSYTGMLLPTQHRLSSRKTSLTKKKNPRHCNVPECLENEGVRRVSPVLVFFKYQFKLHYIHQEVVEIMGFPGLWAKSP